MMPNLIQKFENWPVKLLAVFVAWFLIGYISGEAMAQRPRFGDPFRVGSGATNALRGRPVQFQVPAGAPPAITPNNLPTLGAPTFSAPTIISSPPPISTVRPPTVFQGQPVFQGSQVIQGPGIQVPSTAVPGVTAPSFDPFRSNNAPFPSFQGQIYPAPNSRPVFGNGGAVTAPSIQLPQSIEVRPPQVQVPQVLPQNNGVVFPNPQLQVRPNGQPAVFPQQGSFGVQPYDINNQWPYGTSGNNWWPSLEWPSQVWARLRSDVLPRVLERPRIRHTYMFGNSGNELGVNDTEVATTATIASFGRGGQPLRISPGFIWHFWSGPDTDFTGVDLPSKAYSAYIATDYISDPSARSGFESNLAVGIYSDFDHISSDSWRITGTLLGWHRLNSYSTGKLGIEYFDRVDTKLLPAFGVFMTPNPDLKLDIYFPRPKLAQRIPNYGNFEIWAYVGGEYGGGSWTIERLGNFDDQVDINEVRSFIGAEWVGPRNVTGFLEFGYVFDRELVFKSDELNKTELQDTVMVRTGLAF